MSLPASVDFGFARLTQLLGPDIVGSAEHAQAAGEATSGVGRHIPFVLRPRNAQEVAQCVTIAQECGLSLYPVSTGKNWGYGCSTPVRNGAALLDLSGLNRIVAFDEALGTVTLEPGVTQRQLRAYLDQRGLPFLVPVTGAGPDCSLLGNALERGYGITPQTDHFLSLQSLEAVLPDGTWYRSPLAEIGGATLGSAFKWGIGPYLDGLFTQSGLGVVTQATFALTRRPECVEAFFFWVESDEQLEATAEAVHGILRDLPGLVSAINLLNRERILSMMIPYPHELTPPDKAIPEADVARLAKQNQISAWMGLGGLYGTKKTVAAAKAEIKRRLSHVSKRTLFVNGALMGKARRWAGWLPGRLGAVLDRIVKAVSGTIDILEGRPSEVALPLAYWRSGTKPAAGQAPDPTKDGCGLLWHAPLVPMNSATVRAHVELVKQRCHANGLNALITLTTVSDRCFDSSVPLLFDRHDAAQVARALTCQRELVEQGRPLGLVPYRLGTHAMEQLVTADVTAFALGARIKQTLDPNEILAPGRYTAPRAPAPPAFAGARVGPAPAHTNIEQHLATLS